MLKKSQAYTILKRINKNFQIEDIINPNRILQINEAPLNDGPIVYIMSRELRVDDNFALNFANFKKKELKKELKTLVIFDESEIKDKNNFLKNEIERLKTDFKMNDLEFEIFNNDEKIKQYIEKINPTLIVVDFNPLDKITENLKKYRIFEIDGHNIVPARFVSSKQEYGAYTLRGKIYSQIFEFIKEYPKMKTSLSQAHKALKVFIENDLSQYNEYKNDPSKDVVSKLSKYLNLGFVSSLRVAIEVLKAPVDDINKEVFLEELIVRKELSDNFCLYNKNFKSLKGAPSWGQETLDFHKNDIRNKIYSRSKIENAKTYDNLWNASQTQLIREGRIHGYLRMYWAKMILQWSKSPNDAVQTAIFLNDKYAYDAPSTNGYVGILWAIAGLHDRPFQERQISGKIRIMTYKGAKSKFDIQKYINKYS